MLYEKCMELVDKSLSQRSERKVILMLISRFETVSFSQNLLMLEMAVLLVFFINCLAEKMEKERSGKGEVKRLVRNQVPCQ